MVKLTTIILLLIMAAFRGNETAIPSYISYGMNGSSMASSSQEVKFTMATNGFRYLGEYSSNENADSKVLIFTHPALIRASRKVPDRGLLGSMIKIALVEEANDTEITVLNPEYLIYAYWQDRAGPLKREWIPAVQKMDELLTEMGETQRPYDTRMKPSKLIKFRDGIGLPGFNDPVQLHTFNSYDEGIKKIRLKLIQASGQIDQVYELVDEESQSAVFGIALANKSNGEEHFISKLEMGQIAGLPYEIILNGNEVSILSGKYRQALHWPDMPRNNLKMLQDTHEYIEIALMNLISESSL